MSGSPRCVRLPREARGCCSGVESKIKSIDLWRLHLDPPTCSREEDPACTTLCACNPWFRVLDAYSDMACALAKEVQRTQPMVQRSLYIVQVDLS